MAAGIAYRRARRAAFAVLTGLLACCTFGCSLLCPTPSPQCRTPAGSVDIRYPVCRRLNVTQQQFRRDDTGRLVVSVTFQNSCGRAFDAQLIVRFQDAQGAWEQSSLPADVHRFLPGKTVIEWTSYGPEAVAYQVRVTGGTAFCW